MDDATLERLSDAQKKKLPLWVVNTITQHMPLRSRNRVRFLHAALTGMGAGAEVLIYSGATQALITFKLRLHADSQTATVKEVETYGYG